MDSTHLSLLITLIMKQWIVKDKEHGLDALVFEKEAPIPKVGENEVLVKMEAASLNYRDLIIPQVSDHSGVRGLMLISSSR
jgi:NADPH:quinone reductase-like Zn-dependent oxidoreductase